MPQIVANIPVVSNSVFCKEFRAGPGWSDLLCSTLDDTTHFFYCQGIALNLHLPYIGTKRTVQNTYTSLSPGVPVTVLIKFNLVNWIQEIWD